MPKSRKGGVSDYQQLSARGQLSSSAGIATGLGIVAIVAGVVAAVVHRNARIKISHQPLEVNHTPNRGAQCFALVYKF